MGPKKDGKKKKPKDPNKPKRAMTAYFYYAKHCREELAKQGKKITRVGDFTKEVSAKWRVLTDTQKQEYNDSAGVDRKRYETEMAIYRPKKDANKKKRAATPYFHFLASFRKRPECASMHIKDISKSAGKMWREMTDAEKQPFKEAYEKQKKELALLQAGGDAGGAKAAPPPPPPPAAAAMDEDDEDDDEEYDDDEDDDE